jgi:N-acetylglutamate synthase/N-acetylornithine aminotransferase
MAAIRITGFKFAGLSCAINKSKRRDLALIASDELVVVAAARLATNRVKAAPVMMEMHHHQP